MGRNQRHALSLAGVMTSVVLAVPAQATDIVMEIGSPFTSLRAKLPLSDWIHLDPHLDVLDGRALRPGISAGLSWLRIHPSRLELELGVARSFGLTAVNSFDLDLVQQAHLSLDERSALDLRLGMLAYLGPERTQRGILFFGALRLWTRIGGPWQVGFELGWIGDRFENRPLGGLSLAWTSRELE